MSSLFFFPPLLFSFLFPVCSMNNKQQQRATHTSFSMMMTHTWWCEVWAWYHAFTYNVLPRCTPLLLLLLLLWWKVSVHAFLYSCKIKIVITCTKQAAHTSLSSFTPTSHLMSGDEEYVLVAPPGDGVSDLTFSPSPSNLLLVSSWDSVSCDLSSCQATFMLLLFLCLLCP